MRHRAKVALFVPLAWLGFRAGCAAPPTDIEVRHPRAAAADLASPPREPGTIDGEVRWVGAVPRPRIVPVPEMAESECDRVQEVYGGVAHVDSRTGGLAGAFVVLRGVEPPAGREPTTATVAVRGCALDPLVVQATVGDTLRIHNEDARAIGCGLGPAPRVDRKTIRPSESSDFPLERSGGQIIDCIPGRPWLMGHLLVAKHPFHAVTDAEGRFQIAGVPPGRYGVDAWHPARHTSTVVEVRAGETTNVVVALDRDRSAQLARVVDTQPGEEPMGEEPSPRPEDREASPGDEIRALSPSAEPRAPSPSAEVRAPSPSAEPRAPRSEPRAPSPSAEARAPSPSPEVRAPSPEARAPSPPAPEPTGTPAEQAGAHLTLGRAALASGDAAAAVRHFQAVTRARPMSPPGWKGLGEAQQALGQNAEAIRAYRRYLLIAPGAGDEPAIRGRLQRLGAR